jgi:transcriptional regulator with XRE-family HTH domain
MINIGKNIKSLRHSSGFTQAYLAESLGISVQAVSKWENGTSLPDIMLLPELAREFGISIDELFSEDEKR